MQELSETLNTSSKKKIWQSANEFSYYIESMAADQEISCYDAMLAYCEREDVEPEALAPLVNRQLKDKLAIEFADMGLLKKQPSLYD